MHDQIHPAKQRHTPSSRRIALALVVAALFAAGVWARLWTWNGTTHLRYQQDLANGFYWGSETVDAARAMSPDSKTGYAWRSFFRAYFALYDRVKQDYDDNDFHLDYPPLRLLVMSLWARQVRNEFPGVEDGTPDYAEPLLDLNIFCEALSSAGIFLLVRHWVRKAEGSTESRFLGRIPMEDRGWLCGLMAATAAWFDPSMIIDAHGWPQWDVWIVPFYVFAALAASNARWFLCGALLAAGGMFKGQLLFVAPFFLLWPAWEKKWAASLRVLAGFLTTAAVLVSPWLLRDWKSWALVAGIVLVSRTLLAQRPGNHANAWCAGLAAVAVFVAGALRGGSYSWLEIGFLYGTKHYPYLFISTCYNLPSLLGDMGWSLKDPLLSVSLGSLHPAITLQWALRLLYFCGLALCAFGAARHACNRHPNTLIAMAAPWLLMFALLGQMHERYLMWGAIVSAVALGVNLRLSVVHLFITIASATMIGDVMLIDKKLPRTLPVIASLDATRPLASLLVLACVAVWCWAAIVPAPTAPPLLRLATGNSDG